MPKVIVDSEQLAEPQSPCVSPCAWAESHAHLAAILETAVEGIIVIDQQGTIEKFNKAAQRMFGFAPDEVLGRNVSLLMPEPHRVQHGGYMSRFLRTGKANIIGIGREAVGRKNDGTIFPIELAVSEVKVGGRRTFTGIVRDITQQKLLEKEVLEVSEREQRRIGYDLHDGVCQELAGIAFLVQSMQQKLEAKEPVTAGEAARVTGLLQNTVRHARGLAHGLYPVDPQPDGLIVALKQLADLTSDVSKVDCTFRCGKPVEIKDPSAATHLYRIAQEAVRDSIRHGKAARIVIELSRKNDDITLCICDDGIGLSEDGRLGEETVPRMMRHRARVIGARLRFSSRAVGGVRVVCEFPQPPPV